MFRLSATAHADPNELARTAAIDFARRLVQCWQEALGTELLGAIPDRQRWPMPDSTDAIAISIWRSSRRRASSQDALDRLKARPSRCPRIGDRRFQYSGPISTFAIGRFPPLDRIDYLDHAVVLMERERLTPPRPTLTKFGNICAARPFATWVERARSFAETEALKPNDHKMYLRTLLYPGRFCYSWMTGPDRLERGCRGVCERKTPGAARRRPDCARARVPAGRCRS